MHFNGISMNIQEENSARYFRVQSEREQTLGAEATILTLSPVNFLNILCFAF